MSQNIESKRPRGRPRKIEIEESAIAVLDDDTVVDSTEVEQDIVFVSTGSEHKDKVLKGIINDSPHLFKLANKQGKWDDICKSANPGGECEKFAVSQFVEDSKVTETLRAVKNLINYDREGLTLIKSFQKWELHDLIKRLNVPIVKREIEKVYPKKTVKFPIDTNVVVEPIKQPIVNEIKKIYKKGDIIFNPKDSSESYTVGQRGRQKLWVKEMNIQIEQNEIVEPETPKLICDSVEEIIVCPTDKTKFYTTGSRGRIPKWAVEILNERQQKLKDKLHGTVLIDPQDKTKTYTIGQKGRIASFALEQMRALGLDI